MRTVCLIMVLPALCALAPPTVAAAELSGDLVVFHAGSLSFPFEIIEQRFEQLHPGVDVLREAAGSVVCARKISELGRDCDVVASADFRVIDVMLIDGGFCDWNVVFAGNRMVIAYTPGSRYAHEIDSDNWYEILAREDVHWGHSEPDADPCGYRTLMTLQLAESFYGEPGLASSCLSGNVEIRPKSVELIVLLQTGHLDYAFEYQSVAVQHGLPFVMLPAEIDLSDPALDSLYALASVSIAGDEPDRTREMRGMSISYGASIPHTSRNTQAAEAFVAFLLDPGGGLRILEESGQRILDPPVFSAGSSPEDAPPAIRDLTGE